MNTTSGRLFANRGLNVTGPNEPFGAGILAKGGIGVRAEGGIGVFATSTSGSWAGLFNGDVRVTGTLTKADTAVRN